MKKNYLLWLIGGAALYFLTRKEKTGPAANDTDPADGIGPNQGGVQQLDQVVVQYQVQVDQLLHFQQITQ